MSNYEFLIKTGVENYKYPLEIPLCGSSLNIETFSSFDDFGERSEIEFKNQFVAGSAGCIIYKEGIKVASVQVILSLESDSKHINVYYGTENEDERNGVRFRHKEYPSPHHLLPHKEIYVGILKDGKEVTPFKKIQINK